MFIVPPPSAPIPAAKPNASVPKLVLAEVEVLLEIEPLVIFSV
jgi:hypothetical protein